MKFFQLLTISVFFSLNLFSQSKDYKKYAAEAEQKMWGVNDPLFKNNTIPAEYKNESAVVLARKESFETDKKGVYLTLILLSNDSRRTYFTKTFHEKLLLNDQAAVKEYSELSFTKLLRKSSSNLWGLHSNFEYSFIGIRIQKPDGSIKKIDIDESAVVIKETDDAKQNKIAVPGLETGDILDYYIYIVEKSVASYESSGENASIVFGSEYPILAYEVSAKIDKKLKMEYQLINNAPKFKVSTDEDGSTICKTSLKNIPKYKGVIWSSEAREIPIIRMHIFQNTSGGVVEVNSKSSDNSDAKMNTELGRYLSLIRQAGHPLVSKYDLMKTEFSELVKKQTGVKKIKNADPKEVLPLAIPFIRYSLFVKPLLRVDYDRQSVFSTASAYDILGRSVMAVSLLQDFNISSDVSSVTNRYNLKPSFAINNIADRSFFVKVNYDGKGNMLYLGDGLHRINDLIEGADNESFRSASTSEPDIKLPAIKNDVNYEKETLSITPITASNEVNIKRNIISRGIKRIEMQKAILTTEEYLVQTCKQLNLGDPYSLYESANKSNKKSLEEFKSALKKESSKQNERIEAEIKGQYDEEAEKLIDYKIRKSGLEINGEEPSFELEEEFTFKSWIKKAGNNYIVEIGRSIGSQLEIKADQRERKADVYMPYPRTFEFSISFIVPDGYTVEGIDKLNMKVENECGGFVSTAVLTGKQLNIEAKKYYINSFEPAANWPKIYGFLDAATEFYKTKILLKKQ